MKTSLKRAVRTALGWRERCSAIGQPPLPYWAKLLMFQFVVRQANVKNDLVLACRACGAVCDIEPGDSLATLFGFAGDHECGPGDLAPQTPQ